MEKFVCGKNKKLSSWYVRVGLTPAVVNVGQKGLRIVSNKASPYADRFSKLLESVFILFSDNFENRSAKGLA
jgi:hypothetical protein